ncbi:GAF domain-containing sensor histidine kinase [Arthrobacter sp. M4]|uniref:GAF domain-containing sensor histidine kinase n=1 Tax=Arthrobacter sp. M4 TaxID=218160 RepID=UPI001CDB9112|nr:GAF domain-containing sensor histidine kinase [Arthrobacter sp. M4]MCA4134929.1 GAF domain-containing sensor histidine kinase [Arthrobacter sp. M4]
MDSQGSASSQGAGAAGVPGTAARVPGARIEDLLTDFLDRAGELLQAQQKMRSLLQAVVGVAEDLSLDTVLNRVVSSACRLVQAKYGALGVIGEDRTLSHFITVGIDDEQARLIGPRPKGHGVLGELISHAAPLRLHDLRAHPKSYGFPANHPPMTTFLGVPIRVRDVVFGNLYLTEKEDGGDFTPEDEDLAVALAAAAGVAIENARLFEDARRRASWLEASMEVTGSVMGREAEGGLDDIAARALQESGAQLALILVPASDAYYRVAGSAGESALHVPAFLQPLDVPELKAVVETGSPASLGDSAQVLGRVGDASALGPLLAVELGAQGAHHGLLLLARASGDSSFPRTDVEMGAVFGSHVALALELARAHRLREQLAVFQDRDRIARDLHDVVIQRLFAAGLSIQSLRRFTTADPALERIDAVTAELDGTIRDLRNTIYSLRSSAAEAELLSSRLLRTVRAAGQSLTFSPHLILSGAVDAVVDPSIVENLLAVVTEGLSNAVRHSEATAIEVSVAVSDGTVSVTVKDNGRGIGSGKGSGTATPGHGLENLQQRARELGGTFSVGPAPGRGTVLSWSVPAADDVGNRPSGRISPEAPAG